MKIIFLGTSHGYAEVNRFKSATLIENNGNYYLIDAGAPVPSIMKNKGLDIQAIRGIFITHLHGDHVCGLEELVEHYARYRETEKADCFIPEKKGLDSFINWLEVTHNNMDTINESINFSVYESGKIFDDKNVSVTAVFNYHLERGKYPSYSFIVEANGKKILFTGDMCHNFPEYPSIVEGKKFDLVVCEMAHSNLVEQKEKLKATCTERMIINHYHNVRINGYEEIFKEFPFPVCLAKDGDVYEL